MSGGGKGGSTTSTVEVPAFLENAAQSNLAKADTLSRIGYTPYYGPDVAAMTPMQIASMQGTNAAASAFGLPTADPMAGMGQPLSFGGIPAYSSGGMYDQALAELQRRQPGQYNALRAPFIDPVTGAQPAAPFGFGGTGPGVLDMGMPAPSPVVAPFMPVVRDGGGGGGGGGGGSMSSGMSAGGGTGSFGLPDPMSGKVSSVGGFTGIRDMFDGGGAGQSGTTFSGGPLSGILNTVGVAPAQPAPAPAPVAAPAKPAPVAAASVAAAQNRAADIALANKAKEQAQKETANRAAAANRVADQSLAGKAAVQSAKEVGKALQGNRAADKAIADKAKSQADKAAASKAKSEASQGKGGKSGPSGGGSKSGGGSNKGRR
jgi:hypothetical protein